MALATAGALSVPAQAGEDAVWFYAWNNTIPQEVVQQFGERHGVNVVVDTFMVADEAEARLAVAADPERLTPARLLLLLVLGPSEIPPGIWRGETEGRG